MLEKIKVNLSKSTYNTLINDCRLFEFFKKDGSLNKNAFINTLIANYYRDYTKEKDILNKNIKEIINKYIKDEKTINEKIYNDIIDCETINNTNSFKQETVSLNFKPTKASENDISYIESVLIKNETISGFYRNLFNSYITLPRNKRELIIFKNTVSIINESITNNKKIWFSTKNGKLKQEGSVFKVSSSKEELFNYVLLDLDTSIITIRLSRIKNINTLNKKRNINKEDIPLFDRMIKNGPQYVIVKNENDLIKIKLTVKGLDLYKKVYLYRPDFIEKEDNILTFDCSYNHALFYFSRFGRNAIVLSPKKLIHSFTEFHKLAYYKYKNEEYKKTADLK